MQTWEIIEQIQQLEICDKRDCGYGSIDDWDFIDKIDFLVEELRKNKDGYLACESLFRLFEKYPNREFGTPGEPVHCLEQYSGVYENFLCQSLKRQPTVMTLWMLNRIINAADSVDFENYLELLHQSIHHPLANKETIALAEHFYQYQRDRAKERLSAEEE